MGIAICSYGSRQSKKVRISVRSFLDISLWSGFFLVVLAYSGIYAQSQDASQGSPETGLRLDSVPFVSQQLAPHNDPDLADAKAMVQHSNYANAEKRVRAYLSAHANSAEGHFLLGYIFYREDKPTDSLAEYTQGAQFRKPDANILAIVAMDYVLLHDYADADKWLTQSTQWQPEDALYWYYLGRTKYVENHFHEAVDAFKKCLAIHRMDVRAEYNLGLSYAGLGLDEAAEAAYKNAIAWQQSSKNQDSQPYLDLGILLAEQEHGEQALLVLKKAEVLDPKNPRVHEELGRVNEQLHQLTNAQGELERAVSLAPNVPALHFELGRIYKKEGMNVRAKNEFARCAVLNGTHSTDSNETPNADFHK